MNKCTIKSCKQTVIKSINGKESRFFRLSLQKGNETIVGYFDPNKRGYYLLLDEYIDHNYNLVGFEGFFEYKKAPEEGPNMYLITAYKPIE